MPRNISQHALRREKINFVQNDSITKTHQKAPSVNFNMEP